MGWETLGWISCQRKIWHNYFSLWSFGYYFQCILIICCFELGWYVSFQEWLEFSTGWIDGWNLSVGDVELWWITNMIDGRSECVFKITFSHIVYRPQYISVPVSSVTQSCPALRDPVDRRPPGSSVHRLPQARTLEWVANFLFQGIFPTQGSNPCLLWCLHRRQVLYHFATWEVP